MKNGKEFKLSEQKEGLLPPYRPSSDRKEK
jgi:hypothetical protein